MLRICHFFNFSRFQGFRDVRVFKGFQRFQGYTLVLGFKIFDCFEGFQGFKCFQGFNSYIATAGFDYWFEFATLLLLRVSSVSSGFSDARFLRDSRY